MLCIPLVAITCGTAQFIAVGGKDTNVTTQKLKIHASFQFNSNMPTNYFINSIYPIYIYQGK